VKLNSRAVNPRRLQDALAALALAASNARLTPPCPSPPASPRNDPAVLEAARRASLAGASARQIAGAALLPLNWAYGAARYGASNRLHVEDRGF
jgi:hypothetical protein